MRVNNSNEILSVSGIINTQILSVSETIDTKILSVSEVIDTEILSVSEVIDTKILSVSQAFAPLYSQVFTLLSVSAANDANILSVSNVIDVGMLSLSNEILSVSGVIDTKILSVSNASANNEILNAPHARGCLTIEQKDEIVVKQKGKCACCGEKLVKTKIEFDHRKALANGGTNAVDNFQALCPSCHQDKTSHELHAGYTFRSSFASILHPQMQEELLRQESNLFLSYARVEFIGELKWIPNPDRQIDPDAPALDDYVIEHPDLAEADMVKCRRHLQGGYHYDTKYFDWPVYTLIDLPRPYSGQLQCGLFYVETTLDLGPFRGNGWYFECSCIWALNRGLITQQDIHLEWIPSRSVPHDHFRPLIQQLLDAFAFDEDLQKRAPNYFVGMCNKMTKKSRSVKMSLSKDEAGTWLARKDFSFVRKLELPCGTGLYMGTFVSEVTSETTCRLIYQMTIQMEAIQVENLRAIVQQWAPPYSLKTDAVQVEEPGQVEAWEMQDWVRQQFWDQEHTIPKYRYVVADTVKPLARPAMADFVRE